MEPELPKPPQMNSHERVISPFHTSESVHQPNSQLEKAPSAERGEQKTGAGVGDAGGPTLPPPLSTDQPVQRAVNDTTILPTSSTSASNNPLAADDVDVIEKEWVVRAKQIVNQTKNDPYQQEHEVSKLQADYLRKRFGVEVKLPQD